MNTNSRSKLCWIILAGFLFSACRDNPYVMGQRLYDNGCANCHMSDGSGLGKLIPDLRKSLPKTPLDVQVCILQNGYKSDSLGSVMQAMPAFGHLSDADLSNLINFINAEWGSVNKEINAGEIQSLRSACR